MYEVEKTQRQNSTTFYNHQQTKRQHIIHHHPSSLLSFLLLPLLFFSFQFANEWISIFCWWTNNSTRGDRTISFLWEMCDSTQLEQHQFSVGIIWNTRFWYLLFLVWTSCFGVHEWETLKVRIRTGWKMWGRSRCSRNGVPPPSLEKLSKKSVGFV